MTRRESFIGKLGRLTKFCHEHSFKANLIHYYYHKNKKRANLVKLMCPVKKDSQKFLALDISIFVAVILGLDNTLVTYPKIFVTLCI